MNQDPGMGGGRPDDGLPDDGLPDDGLPDELRRRLQDAVADVRPASDALDRLRDAVPARRRRRRATMLTTAATVVVLAVATPMVRTMVISDQNTQNSGSGTEPLLPNVDTPGADDDNENEDSDGGTLGIGSVGGIAGSGGSRPSPGQSAAASAATPGSTLLPSFAPSYVPGIELPSVAPTTATATVGPSASTPPPAPACTINDLEQGTGTRLGQAGTDGIAYGVVEIRNTSRRECSITGQGNVMVASPPGNAPIQVSVTVHQQGDPAVRLPEVAPATAPLTVRPGATYEFQFAWRPTLGAGVGGSCTTGDNSPPPPVPALGYALADDGVKLAEVQLTAACGGVVYRTDVYPSGAYPKA